MENFKGEPMLWKFAFYFTWCVLRESSITENISMDITSSQFYKKYNYTYQMV